MSNIKIFWSPEALEDLKSIVDFIKRDSEFYSKAVLEKIFKRIEDLESFPQMGKIVPEINKSNFREIIVYSYRVNLPYRK